MISCVVRKSTLSWILNEFINISSICFFVLWIVLARDGYVASCNLDTTAEISNKVNINYELNLNPDAHFLVLIPLSGLVPRPVKTLLRNDFFG